MKRPVDGTVRWMGGTKTTAMKQELRIAAFFDQPELLQNLVERLAYRHSDLGYCRERVPTGYKALESSTNEAYVSGSLLMISEEGIRFKMAFITAFQFTCIKGKEDPYHLSWSLSLS